MMNHEEKEEVLLFYLGTRRLMTMEKKAESRPLVAQAINDDD